MIWSRCAMLACGAILGTLSLPIPSLAQTSPAHISPAQTARDAMQALDQATLALGDAQKSQDRVAALTQTVKAYEKGLSTLRDSLRRARLREVSIQTALDSDKARLSKLLGVLQTIERAPEPALLVHPEGPIGTARSGMILADVVPALQDEATTLRRGLEELQTLRTVQEESIETLQAGLEGVHDARFELSLSIARRIELPRRFVADSAQMELLLQSADTLESFAAGLSAQNVPATLATAPMRFESLKGRLALPVLGRIIRNFEDTDAAGVQRPGLILAARPLAIVTSPWPATIRYLGPLLDYGNVIILEPDDGYLLVLAGLGQLYGKVGEVLPQGAPVGMMGGAELTGDQAFLIETTKATSTIRSETLYIELRKNGAPVDPSDWFAASKE